MQNVQELALNKNKMEQTSFNKLLLKTAFSCMACDGHIDDKEVALIKTMNLEKKIFGEIDIDKELNKLRVEINDEGNKFLRKYFNELISSELGLQDELKLIEVAIETIKADNKVEYSEIKFFKLLRSNLRIENKPVLEKHPDFEDYLEQDILSESYLSRLQDNFFDTKTLPAFDLINSIDEITIQNLTEKKGEGQ
jgi:hypothetical protein